MHAYPIDNSNEQFRMFQQAWREGWEAFLYRMSNPDAKSTSTDVTQGRPLLELMMSIGSQIPSVTSSEAWETREEDMAGRLAQEVVQEWSNILTGALTEHTNVSASICSDLVTILRSFNPTPELSDTTLQNLRANRLVAAQLLSKLSSNSATAENLVKVGGLAAVYAQIRPRPKDSIKKADGFGGSEPLFSGKDNFGDMNFREEDLAVQCLLHFLIQTAGVWYYHDHLFANMCLRI